MFTKVLIANRGEIACRVIRTCQKLGIKTVAVYSDADEKALHVKMADEAVHIGASQASESYLRADTIIKAAKKTKAQAIHPGYGFLSESPAFARAVEKAGLAFIGPTGDIIEQMGDKVAARKTAVAANVPVVPGTDGEIEDSEADDPARRPHSARYAGRCERSGGGDPGRQEDRLPAHGQGCRRWWRHGHPRRA